MTPLGNYLVEVDGVGSCRAQEVETGALKHEPVKIHTGDSPNPTLARGKYEASEVKVKHVHGLTNAGAELAGIFRDYILGINTQKLNIRIVTLSEDGVTPIGEDNYINCVPTEFTPESKKADSKDAATFTIAFLPEDHIPSY